MKIGTKVKITGDRSAIKTNNRIGTVIEVQLHNQEFPGDRDYLVRFKNGDEYFYTLDEVMQV
jgi:hypothetical protein